jgi:hypothetical protein
MSHKECRPLPPGERMNQNAPRIYIAYHVSNTPGAGSIALVSDEGAEYYAESTSDAELLEQLHAYLSQVRGDYEHLDVAYDDPSSWQLLVAALGKNTPDWIRPDYVSGQVDESIRDEFFAITHMPRHDPLWRARALRSAHTLQK